MVSQEKTIRNTAILSCGTLFSRILGFIRDILFAAILGSDWIADVFMAAYRLPNFARRLFQEGAVALAFIPLFNREKAKEGKERAFTFARTALVHFVLAALCLALLGIYGAQAIAVFLVPGFDASPQLIEITGQLMATCFYYLPLVGAATICSSVLMALGRFGAPALTPAALNLAFITVAAYIIVTDMPVYHAVFALCGALLLGGALQVLVQVPSLSRAGMSFLGPLKFDSGAEKDFIRRAPGAVIGSSAYQLGVLICMFTASFMVEGSVSALYFAERLVELPLAVIGVALGTASLTSFSVLVAENRMHEAGAYLSRMLSLCLFLALPCAVGLGVLAYPLVDLFFDHGAFTAEGVRLTGTALLFYAPGLLAVAMTRPLLSALNAIGKSFTTLLCSFVSLGVLAILIFKLSHLQIAGIGISASVGAWVNFALLYIMLMRSEIGNRCSFPFKSAIYYVLLSAVMFAVLQGISFVFVNFNLPQFAFVPVAVLLGAVCYLGLCRVLYPEDIKIVAKAFGRQA